MLSGEATNTNFIVFGLTRPGHRYKYGYFFRTIGKHFDFEDNVEFKQVYKLTIYFYKVSILLINYNIKFSLV